MIHNSRMKIIKKKSKIKVFPASIDRGRPSCFGVAGVCSTREFAVVGWQAPLLALCTAGDLSDKERKTWRRPDGLCEEKLRVDDHGLCSSPDPVDYSVRRK